MPNGLESRLRDLLARLPRATDAVEERALATALAALPAVESGRRRPLRGAVLVAAAAVCLLAVSAGALAAAGALHVSLGRTGTPSRAQAQTAARLVVPRGARGIAAVVDGRLWLTSSGGLRIEDLPVDSAALSPHALYVATGIGNSLVVMAPNGTRAWSHPAGGRVVAIAWAPSGLRIAYIVERHSGSTELRMIEGDGDHDQLLDAAVRGVAPSWRADALAVAYVGAGGRPVVYDLARRAHHVVEGEPVRNTTRVAFAPQGTTLAIASPDRLWVSGAGRVTTSGAIAGLAWTGGDIAVALDPRRSGEGAVVRVFHGDGVSASRSPVNGRITALDAAGSQVVLAVQEPRVPTRLVASAARQVLLEVAAGSTVSELAVR